MRTEGEGREKKRRLSQQKLISISTPWVVYTPDWHNLANVSFPTIANAMSLRERNEKEDGRLC